MNPDAAYRFIHDELMLDGSSRLNLATFVTTWMDPQAEKLMAETFDKNMIDKDEYPATAAIESRCVCMVADLFHAEDLRRVVVTQVLGVEEIGDHAHAALLDRRGRRILVLASCSCRTSRPSASRPRGSIQVVTKVARFSRELPSSISSSWMNR